MDLNSSVGYFHSPNGGLISKRISPGRIEYLGASIAKKEEKKKKFK
jgi:hypothetical protein